jgi:hypothetical protein
VQIAPPDDTRTEPRRSGERAVTGWGTAVRLAIVLSVVSALFVATFAGRVAGSTLICVVIAVGSVVGWISAERAPLPAALRLRRR